MSDRYTTDYLSWLIFFFFVFCSCDGGSKDCPIDARLPAGTVCRQAVDSCDIAEECDGNLLSCPFDSVRARGFVCRASQGECDLEET